MQLDNQSHDLVTSTKTTKIIIQNDYLQQVQRRFAIATINNSFDRNTDSAQIRLGFWN
ncbi:hypothetical protein [Nostoc sp.]|uniref:hypothetical protein n=1 Tax=Nostoc sp. TaxID=1180 RepID=UPI002FF61A78